MKYVIEVPDYDPIGGLTIDWEDNYRISTKIDPTGAITIVANSSGLISLARHLLVLAQPSVPQGWHLHYDDYFSLENGSTALIIERE